MNAANKTLAFSILLFICSSAMGVEFEYSGFGSLTAGRVISGEVAPNSSMDQQGYKGIAYMADYTNTGVYEDKWSVRPESIIGLQGNLKASDNLEITAQITGRAIDSAELDISWLYASYTLDPKLRLQVGRKRLPIYYYSDYLDVAYAYPWVRAPEIAYSWQITHYNGANLLYEDYLGGWDFSANLYTGEERDDNNKLMQFFLNERVNEHWTNMLGTSISISNSWLDLRLAMMKNKVERTVGDAATASAHQDFYGIAAKLNYQGLSFLAERQWVGRSNYSADINIHIYSLDYNIGDFTPYLAYNDFLSPSFGEEHSTKTAGVRWDFAPNMAAKLQLDRYSDRGTLPLGGDAKLFSASLDFTF